MINWLGEEIVENSIEDDPVWAELVKYKNNRDGRRRLLDYVVEWELKHSLSDYNSEENEGER